MSKLKLTKTELRTQQTRLKQLEKYLPVLQLKKAMLQAEVHEARVEIAENEEQFNKQNAYVNSFAELLSDQTLADVTHAAKVENVNKTYENVAGVEVPYFKGITFQPFSYFLFSSPPWMDSMIVALQKLVEANVRIDISKEKKEALEKELKSVSIRVNLFEKVLIPRSFTNIKKIKVFLGDQELASVGRAKVAKEKIQMKKVA